MTTDTPTAHRRMDAHDLHRALDEFVRNNASHHNVEYRYLAQQAITLKGMAYNLHANGIGSFAKAHHEGIAALRLSEIEEERSKIAKADAKLLDEADKLKRGRAAQ